MGDVTVGGRTRPLPADTVRRVVRAVLAGERRDADISVTFLGRDLMRRLNLRYKQRDEPTDVIAFTLQRPGAPDLGDVYICAWMAARHARTHGIRLREELVRLVVHGVLHVLGHDHPADDARTRSPMWRRQERYVARLT